MTENDLFDKNEIALIQSFLGNYISQNQDNVNSKELNDTPVLAYRSTCRRNEKNWKKIIKGVGVMKATKNNIKLLNEYIQDIGRATEFIESRFLLSPEEFMRLPYATQKNVYEKHLVIFTWIRHDLNALYSIVNDKEYKPFNGEKFYQTWLKLRENERSKKKKLSDFLKED